MAYHITGAIAAAAFLLTVLGETFQLLKVWRRRVQYHTGLRSGELPTAVLSLQQVASVFLACVAFVLYALSLSPINLYLGIPRLAGAVLAVLLIREIVRDRPTREARVLYAISMGMMAGIPVVRYLIPSGAATAVTAKTLILAATALLAYGYTHQIRLIRKTRRTGAVSLRFHQCVLASALSTVALGASMGPTEGWPLMLLASVSATLKIITLWHFRWVRAVA